MSAGESTDPTHPDEEREHSAPAVVSALRPTQASERIEVIGDAAIHVVRAECT